MNPIIYNSLRRNSLSSDYGLYFPYRTIYLWVVTLLITLLITFSPNAFALQQDGSMQPPAESTVDMEIFIHGGCPICEEAMKFIDRLKAEHPDLRIAVADIAIDQVAKDRLNRLVQEKGKKNVSTPTFYLKDIIIIGWIDEKTTGAKLKDLLLSTSKKGELSVKLNSGAVDLPWVGKVNVHRVGIFLFSFLVGLIDGFNPCAMWALLFILSMLINLRDRKKMLIIGGTFIFVGGAIYYAFMAAWLEVFLLIGLSKTVQIVLGIVALIVGLISIKDFIFLKRGISLSIPDSVKPKLYDRARRVITANNLLAAIIAVATLSILVNIVELLCTAGLPAIYTEILATYQLQRWQYYGYLLVYIAAYIFDDTLMLILIVITLDRWKLQERGGKWLKLINGLVMILLGVVLLR
jgi:thiol-disulfide isomerase/thioredoxin